MNIEEYIAHSALKPDTFMGDIEIACREAIECKLTTVCVPPLFVKAAKRLTAQTGINISTVVGYPFGYSAIEAKIAEIVLAIIDGVDEVEMVINIGAVKNKDWQFLANEINTAIPIIRKKEKRLTVIIETALLTDEEMITACDIYGAAGVDFIRIGTGIMENKLVIENLKLIRKHLADPVKIKVAADIKNYTFAKTLIGAGANRLYGNNSLKIITEAMQQN